MRYIVGPPGNRTTQTPEQIGSHILRYLKHVAEANLTAPVTKAVMSVPAEFDELQRNATIKAANLIGKQCHSGMRHVSFSVALRLFSKSLCRPVIFANDQQPNASDLRLS